MNYLDPLPWIRIKRKENSKLKCSPKAYSLFKNLEKNPYITINNYNNYFDKYRNVYGKSLTKSKIGYKKNTNKMKLSKIIINKNKVQNKEEGELNKKDNINKTVKLNQTTKIVKKEKFKIKITQPNYTININKKSKELENSLKKEFWKNFYKSFNDNKLNLKIDSSNKNNKVRKSLVPGSKNNKKILKSINSQIFNKEDKTEDINKLSHYDLNIIFKKNHHIKSIIDNKKEIYQKIIIEKNYSSIINLYNLKIFHKNQLIFLNSIILQVNDSEIMIPFCLSYFLMKYEPNYLIKFMIELIFLLYRRKLKGFKKSILDFHNFYLINKQVINITLDKFNKINEEHKILEIPQNNKKIRKSIFFNNFNNNIISKDQLNSNNNLKKNSSKNISRKSSKKSSINTGSNTSKSSYCSNESESSKSSYSSSSMSENINDYQEKLKSENTKIMEIRFSRNFSKSKRNYNAIIKFPLAIIYSEGFINNDNKKIIRISNKEIEDIVYYNKDNINYMIERISNN